MRAPGFQHLTGTRMWRRCDHARTRIDGKTATVRLAPHDLDGKESVVCLDTEARDDWMEPRGGAVALRCPPVECETETVLLADTKGVLRVLGKGRWVRLVPLEERLPALAAADPLAFGDAAGPGNESGAVRYRALERDPHGRMWLLEHGEGRACIRLLSTSDLRLLDTVASSPGAEPVDLAATRWGVVVIDPDSGWIWRQPYGGEWEPVVLGAAKPEHALRSLEGYTPVACAGGEDDRATVILWPDGEQLGKVAVVAVVKRDSTRRYEITELFSPLHLLVLQDGHVLIGEATGKPGEPGPAVFFEYALGESEPDFIGSWAVRGFDGRALFLDLEGRPHASTKEGVRPLFRRKMKSATDGMVETFALDSEIYGCVWHRVFVDVCLPSGAEVEISARTSDDFWPDTLMANDRPRRPYVGIWSADEALEAEERAVEKAWEELPLGSRSSDDVEGWVPVGMLDRRTAHVDLPFPPRRCEDLPFFDPQAPRGPEFEPVALETLEGLLKNRPGRYLWLRIALKGRTQASPALHAMRVTYPRPSMLDELPGYWRAEPAAADRMERTLALFEGHVTEIDGRIEVMRRLFDPQLCPSEAMEFLAGFVALALDVRLSTQVRRQLLMETTALYRQRGTVRGLERLCTIVGQCRVKVIETYRVRQRTPAFVGARDDLGVPDVISGVLGPGLQLGRREEEIDAPGTEAWESALLERNAALLEERARDRAAGKTLCPPGELPEPLNEDPLISHYRRFAHRFSVLLFREHDTDIADIVQTAVERFKPAHTLHDMCWLEEGFRLGTSTYVGVGTRFGATDTLSPAFLGDTRLGMGETISVAHPADISSTFVGTAPIGQNTKLG